MPATMPRLGAALVALVCWAGLGVQFAVTSSQQPDVVTTLWVLLRFFTIITNLIVAIAMTAVAVGRRVSPVVLGGITLAILLVGIVYVTLLESLYEIFGWALVSDTLLHKIAPLATALWWLLFAPRGQLRWRDTLWWAAYPLAYFGYALLRGRIDGKYPYPFIDVGELGAAQVALNAVLLAAAFCVAGLALVALDRALVRRRNGASTLSETP